MVPRLIGRLCVTEGQKGFCMQQCLPIFSFYLFLSTLPGITLREESRTDLPMGRQKQTNPGHWMHVGLEGWKVPRSMEEEQTRLLRMQGGSPGGSSVLGPKSQRMIKRCAKGLLAEATGGTALKI